MVTLSTVNGGGPVGAPGKLEPFDVYADPACRLVTPRLLSLHAYWRSKCGDAAMPTREEIHPRDFRMNLSRIFSLDVVAGQGFRFRLAGTAIVDLFGCEPTGKTLTQALGGKAGRAASAALMAVVDYGRPLRTFGTMDWWTPPADSLPGTPSHDFTRVRFEAVHLPLSAGGRAQGGGAEGGGAEGSGHVAIVLSAIATHVSDS